MRPELRGVLNYIHAANPDNQFRDLEMVNQPMDPELMNDSTCMLFVAMLIGFARSDYILGKKELLKYYHDMSYDEWKKIPHKWGSVWMIKNYFEAKENMLNDIYGISGFFDPKDVIAVWDREVEKEMKKK